MKRNTIIKSTIELLLIVLGYFIATFILDPITQFVAYSEKNQITFVTIILVLSVYWILYFNRSIILRSIWVRSCLFIAILIGLLTLTSQFVAFMDIIDSFDISLFGQEIYPMTATQEADVLQYIYRSHLLLFSSAIMSLLVFEFKLLKSILNFISRMQ